MNQAERDEIINTILDSIILQYTFLEKLDGELEELKKETIYTNLDHLFHKLREDERE